MPSSPETSSSIEDLYIAVDLGAGSGRVFLVGLEPGNLIFEEISRFQYPPYEKAGYLRWNFAQIFGDIKSALKKASVRASELARPIRSIGVDSWAVDYGLIDLDGRLLADPVCYRDDRTQEAMERVFSKIPRSEIFEKTGIQFLNFNTIYQLSSEDGGVLHKAEKMLLLPDLINFFLTGRIVAEYTNATTTQLVEARRRTWDSELVQKLGLSSGLFPDIVPAGTNLGALKPEIAEEIDLFDVRVVVTATHDTASAVAGAPLEKDWAYISSGTWSLIGIEQDDVLINADVAKHNFTNEGGVFGTVRLLKNVMGLWIFESCRKEWIARGIGSDYDYILDRISIIDDFPALIFPDDERFLNPRSMLEAIETQLYETGQGADDDPITISKIIFDSLALRYASILRTIDSLTGSRLRGVQIVGGGGRNEYLNQMTADTSGLKVQAGLVEATAMGNALVQAISAGRFASLSEAREYVRGNRELKEYSPRSSAKMTEAARRYSEIEAKCIDEIAVL
jgi:rhamnulokinase